MTKIALVFASPTQAPQPKQLFSSYMKDLSFDSFYLCKANKDKILKKDIDLDFNELNSYDIICPVGGEALKYVCNLTGITKYNGHLITNKFLPIIHPSLVEFKPQYKEDILKACDKLKSLSVGGFDSVTIPVNKHYEYIDKESRALEYLEELEANAVDLVVDIETTSLSAHKGVIIGVALTYKVNYGYFLTAEVVRKFKDRFQDLFDRVNVIFHNGKFDMQFLKIDLGFTFQKYNDTILMHYSLEENVGTHGLKVLALKYTDLGDYEKELDEYKKKFCRANKIKLEDFNYGMLPIEILSPYACKDADATLQLFYKFKPIIDKNDKLTFVYHKLLLTFSRSLMFLEMNGGPVNREKLIRLYNEYEIDIEECTEDIQNDPSVREFCRVEGKDFNPNSVAHLRKVFFDIKKLPPLKRTASLENFSVDKETLEFLEDPLADIILELREAVKLRSTYLENIINGLDNDNRLRSSFNIIGTTSGRLSSSGVLNYQNIPKKNTDIKSIFEARPGFKIVQGDLSTAEVYIAAVLSNDQFLQQAFKAKTDFHSFMAKRVFNLPCDVKEVKEKFPDQRQQAKAITFGIMYQAGPAKIAETITAELKRKNPDAEVTREQAREYINMYFKEARNLKVFIEASNNFITERAFIYSFFGRKRRLPESKSTNKGVAGHTVRSGVNFLVQSVASDINLLGFNDAVEWIKENKYENDILPFTVVHDSIVAEVREDLVDLWKVKLTEFIQRDRGVMIPGCPIGFDLSVGNDWSEC